MTNNIIYMEKENMNNIKKIIDYYSTHSIFTDPGQFVYLYEKLPYDVNGIVKTVQGILLHPRECELYGVSITTSQMQEELLRTVNQMLEKITKLGHAEIIQKKDPENRLIGICRDYALLTISIMRSKGIPARMRNGYAPYFNSNIKNEIHTIAEYYDVKKNKWILIDPQLDEEIIKKYSITFKPLNMNPGKEFYLSGSAWKLCRDKKEKPDDFGYTYNWKGNRCLRVSLLNDFYALNKIELLPWDIWDSLSKKSEKDVKTDEKKFLDKIASASIQNDFNNLISLYNNSSYKKEIDSRIKLFRIDRNTKNVNPVNLIPSDLDMLFGHVNVKKIIPDFHKSETQSITSNHDDKYIYIYGARKHNLKNIDVKIPRNKITVITGVSGSGKSSLAFDTVYAEGQRQYMDSLSTRARQVVNLMEKPDVDHIVGLNPVTAIDQKTVSRNPRSTVGSITEIYNYLRLLFSKIGTIHCPSCGRSVKQITSKKLVDLISALDPGEKIILKNYKNIMTDSFFEFVIPGKITRDFYNNIFNKIEEIYGLSDNKIIINLKNEDFIVTNNNECVHCGITFSDLNSWMFNFNNPEGMCPECNGLGKKLEVDINLIIENPDLSILDGALSWFGVLRNKKRNANWMKGELFALAEYMNVDLDIPWKDLPEDFKNKVLYGTGDKEITYMYENKKIGRSGTIKRAVVGAVNNIRRLFRQSKNARSTEYLTAYMSEKPCDECNGERLAPTARFVTLGNKRFPGVSEMSAAKLFEWISVLKDDLTDEKKQIAFEIITEIKKRLKYILDVGLHYLTIDRKAPTLSGGEGQRIRLAGQLGCGLVGIVYILDEPSIGLHPRDHKPLIETLKYLRDSGNTVIVVEHDEETMNNADWIIDLGPGAGINGGKIIAQGIPGEIIKNDKSLTGKYLGNKLKIKVPKKENRRKPEKWIHMKNAGLHNLKGIDADIPLEVLTCITGVSGSGKSSLISQTLTPYITETLKGNKFNGMIDEIKGINNIDKIINVTQDAIGRTPRSNPATYVEIFDEIRKVFASLKEAKSKKIKNSHFSFNVKGGRCEECQGMGKKKMEMHFMPDIWVTCKDCEGKRYNQKILDIKYKEKSINEVLEMDIYEAFEFFNDNNIIADKLKTLIDVGLGYIKLGQSATTLSGGEAQRIKLAKELGKVNTGSTLYILDEPTTGLHFDDIQKLLYVLHRLVDEGNSVIIIEHNLDVIKNADWIIDLGPGGGTEGGEIVAAGTPEDIKKEKRSCTGRFLKI